MACIIILITAFCAREANINKDFSLHIRTRKINANIGFNAGFFPQYINNAEYRRRYKRELDSLKAGGIDWIRPNLGFNWDVANPRKGLFNTRVMDSLVKWTGERGLRIVPFIMYTPEWAFKDNYYFSDNKHKYEYLRIMPPERMEYWRDFWQFVVERYDGDGYKDYCELKIPVKFYEVWNEPRAMKYFLGSFKEYCNLYIEARKGAMRADSECIVIGPVIEGGNKSTGWALYDSKKMKSIWSFEETFIKEHRISNWLDYTLYFLSYVKEKTGEYPPVISAHLYYSDKTNNPFGRIDTLLFAHVDSLFYYFEQNNIENTEVWFTEVGRRIDNSEEGSEKRLDFTKYIISELFDSPYRNRIRIFFFAGIAEKHAYLEKKNFTSKPAFRYIKKVILNQELPDNH